MATASGLVFIGAALDNYLRAFDGASGRQLWRGAPARRRPGDADDLCLEGPAVCRHRRRRPLQDRHQARRSGRSRSPCLANRAGSSRVQRRRTCYRPATGPREDGMAQLDENKLHEFVGKMLGDLGGAFSVPTVRIGFRLGLFDALHEGGPATAGELAKRAGGLTERYVREWALAQAANGYVDYDPATEAVQPVAGAGDGVRRQGQPRLSGRRLRPRRGDDRGRAQGRERRSAPAPACAGATPPAACSAPPAPSSGRATSTTSSRTGCRPWTASWTS